MRMNIKKSLLSSTALLTALGLFPFAVSADDNDDVDNEDQTEEIEPIGEIEEIDEIRADEAAYLTFTDTPLLSVPENFPSQFKYQTLVDIDYPEDGVKGIFVTAHSAGGSRLETLTELLNTTELNSMVIDVKDDYGDIVMSIDSEHELVNKFSNTIVEPEPLMEHLEENDIYPIARIVVFKDSKLANERPDLSFTNDDGSVWANRRGESFVNPYEREVWEYNVEVARQAAKLGFKDIQFDYVRFPEGFEHRDEDLTYSRGDYQESDLDNVKQRVDAVTEFVAYARRELQPYDVDVSVDIFGYAATREETPGIGQNFSRISENVDVISSMIYPSHWGAGSLGIERPDLEPYNVVANYMELENEILDNLGDDAPISRPWIQDFTASYLGAGWYMNYGPEEVSEQVRALNDYGVNEFLLWNAGNRYSEGAQYSFD